MNFSDTEIARMRNFLRRWKETGPLLQEIRYARLESLTEDEARHISNELLSLWKPSTRDKLGEGLVLQQRVFSRLPRPAPHSDNR